MPGPLDDVLARLERGDPDAAEALFRAYTPYLRAVVRRQLADRLRPKFDSADVVQSVWVQVVKHLQHDGWRVESEAQLRSLLATIARRRLITRVRKDDDPREERRAGSAWDELPATHAARPSEVAQAGDLWGRLLRLCPPEHHVVLELRREGMQLTEIAARTGLHEGSVRRILRKLARELALEDEPFDPPARPAGGDG